MSVAGACFRLDARQFTVETSVLTYEKQERDGLRQFGVHDLPHAGEKTPVTTQQHRTLGVNFEKKARKEYWWRFQAASL